MQLRRPQVVRREKIKIHIICIFHHLRCGGKYVYYMTFFMNVVVNLIHFLAVNVFWKSVKIWRSYRHEFGGLLFWNTVYIRWQLTKTISTRKPSLLWPMTQIGPGEPTYRIPRSKAMSEHRHTQATGGNTWTTEAVSKNSYSTRNVGQCPTWWSPCQI